MPVLIHPEGNILERILETEYSVWPGLSLQPSISSSTWSRKSAATGRGALSPAGGRDCDGPVSCIGDQPVAAAERDRPVLARRYVL